MMKRILSLLLALCMLLAVLPAVYAEPVDTTPVISDEVFRDTPLYIAGIPGSTAHKYALAHGIKFVHIGDVLFEDAQPTAWYYEYVMKAYTLGIMKGTADAVFEPNALTTRAMLAQILYNLAKTEGEEIKSAGFVDVPENAWFADAVNWAAACGLVNGVGDNRFDPNAVLTREQAATILMRFAAAVELDTSAKADLSKYTDASKVSGYAQDAMGWAVGTGLINGTTPTTLDPKGSCTRAQIATIMIRFLENNSATVQ